VYVGSWIQKEKKSLSKATSTTTPSRRRVLQLMGASAALLATTSLSSPSMAQAPDSAPFKFDFEALSARMRTMAAAPYSPATFTLPEAFTTLDYDEYRLIQFRPDQAKWAALGKGFQVQAFHLGWLFKEPVKMYELEDGMAKTLSFSANDFRYHKSEVEAAVKAQDFPGVAGFRLNFPLNTARVADELVSFLGASYFRALGRDNIYGLSSRGLVINSWVEGPEEFPRFSEFYLERPANKDHVILYAALDSQSVTGAYRFEIRPANEDRQETVMDVTARLYIRSDIKEMGIAPLTSMFLFADANRAGFDDYRPQVHDSNGLVMEHENGEVTWRALNNAPSLGNSYFFDNNVRAFGLYQRDRNFETYQDAGAHYERRPSLRVEPLGDWGEGHVRLIEMPSKLEAEDNIGAFFVPKAPAKAGDEREYRYLLRWGDLGPDEAGQLAYVAETRAGQGGVSGVENAANLRKFVVDFKGGELGKMDEETKLEIVANVTGGQLKFSTVSKVAANGVWRLVLDVETAETGPLELTAYVTGAGQKLTETWLYQWRASA
jgi:glucans biosynthesis protein